MKRMGYTFLLLLFMACDPVAESEVDVAPTRMWETPDYAKGFNWCQEGDSLHLRLFNLAGDSSQVLQEWSISAQGYGKIACLSTTHLNLLKTSAGIHHVVAAAYLSYVKDSTVVQMREAGRIRSLGSDGNGDEEVLLESGAEAYLVYPFGGGDYNVIEESGIDVIPVSEYLEWHPLARAEWIRFTGRLVGHGSEADAAWEEIKQNYESIRDQLTAPQTRPVVFNGSEDGGSWFAPGGLSFISTFIRDAGGKYMFEEKQSRKNIQLDIEVFLEEVGKADYWGLVMYDDMGVNLDRLADDYPLLQEMPFFNEQHVFACNTSESDYFGEAVVEPHIILADLAAILHPERLPDHNPVYFKTLEAW